LFIIVIPGRTIKVKVSHYVLIKTVCITTPVGDRAEATLKVEFHTERTYHTGIFQNCRKFLFTFFEQAISYPFPFFEGDVEKVFLLFEIFPRSLERKEDPSPPPLASFFVKFLE